MTLGTDEMGVNLKAPRTGVLVFGMVAALGNVCLWRQTLSLINTHANSLLEPANEHVGCTYLCSGLPLYLSAWVT